VQSFPISFLAERFAMTSLFASDVPYPGFTAISNMKHLDFMNLCDESLGLTQEIYSSLSIPCSFHQLWLFPAAKHFYSQEK
jgi:hypothetical protein